MPPLFLRVYRTATRRGNRFRGIYKSWDDALKHSTGYDSDLILEKVRNAVLKVKKGEAAFERDSVVFDAVQHSFPVLAGLLLAAVSGRDRLSILDFGGSLGSSYYQCRDFLSDVGTLRWGVIEQDKFVDCGKKLFEDDTLKFYRSVEECVKAEAPNVALLSSVIQYIRNPYELVDTIARQGLEYVIIDRTPFTDSGPDILTVQAVPLSIYDASYPIWILNREALYKRLMGPYELVTEFDAIDGCLESRGIKACFRGAIFRRKTHNE